MSVRLDEDVLSNVWYPFRLRSPSAQIEKALCLWLNSSIGILSMAGHRVPTEGPWVQFKKPTLNGIYVFDFRKLPANKLKSLAAAFDSIKTDQLQPIPAMATDPVRNEIDEVIATQLGLPKLNQLRALLAQEPVICNQSIALIEAVIDQLELDFV